MAEATGDQQPETVDIPSQDTSEEEEPNVQRCLKDTEQLKLEGNEHFRGKRWDEALAAYRAGLGRLPKRKPASARKAGSAKGKGKAGEEDVSDDEPESEGSASAQAGKSQEAEAEVPEERPPTALELECAKARSVMNANIAACYVKLNEHKEAVEACSQALLDDPQYVKALQRRAWANEQINSWSSLTAAQEDYNTLLTILPSTSTQITDIKRSLASLQPRLEAAQKRETTEMLDKLKGLGNNILGNFGLSTDNFQFVPNGQGGYSMNFAR